MAKSQTINIEYNGSIIKLKVSNVAPFDDKRVIVAMELAEYYPDSSYLLLAQAAYPNGFIANVIMLKSDVDDNTQSFLDILKAIGIDLMVEVK
jgi:hypothetical protein